MGPRLDSSYVYVHIDPTSGTVVYVGKGCGERAWSNGRRAGAHLFFLRNLSRMGYCPAHWAFVLMSGLTDMEAHKTEHALIQKLTPMFNQTGLGFAAAGRGNDNHNAVLNPETVRALRRDAAAGMTQRALGKKYGVCPSTARKVARREAWKHVRDYCS
jgi:hypothetical protein